jgi:S-DNA-T family DNA segregation ATPase FtsK/SpoIIIE
VITRYEFKPDPGVKLSRIESLENDLAMALEAISIRILAPIPGKAKGPPYTRNGPPSTEYRTSVKAMPAS